MVHKDKDGNLRVRAKPVITVWRFLTTNRFLALLLSTVQAGIAAVAIYFVTGASYAALRWTREKFGGESVAPGLEASLAKLGDLGSEAAFAWFIVSGFITDIRAWWRDWKAPPPQLIPVEEDRR